MRRRSQDGSIPCIGRVVQAGWVPGWGIRVGYTGWVIRAIPVPSPTLLREVPRQRSGPRKPIGAGVGGLGAGIPVGRPLAPGTTLRARSVPCRALPVPGPSSSSKPASWPIRARFGSQTWKVSQNREVSPKYVQKA